MKTTRIDPEAQSLGHWLAQARLRLKNHEADAGWEARALACAVLERSPAWVQSHPEDLLTGQQLLALEPLLIRLEGGTPLPYLTGHQEFYGLEFSVSPSVLIPRPETELLIERALVWLHRHPQRSSAVDVGTGSGCIAVTLAVHHPALRVLAVDLAPAALETAHQNAVKHGVETRVEFQISDLLAATPGPFGLVCANLPYIPSADVDGLEVTRHEPRLALDGGSDGLELIRRLLAQLPSRLASAGLALLEIEYRQGQTAAALAQTAFPGAQICILKDLSGHDRLIEIRLPPE